MRDLHLTPIAILPEITPQDQEFAEKIAKEYDLPLDEISWLVRDVRIKVQTGGIANDLKEYSELKSRFDYYSEKLFSTDVIIKQLTFTTNKGTVKIESTDPLFDFFRNPVTRLKKRIEKDLESEDNYIDSHFGKVTLNTIFVYFYYNTSLNHNRRRIAEGLFMIHFKLYGGTPITAKDDFDVDNSEYTDWEHYISDRVRRWEDKFRI